MYIYQDRHLNSIVLLRDFKLSEYSTYINVKFSNSKEKTEIYLQDIVEDTIDFFEYYGEMNILGESFYSVLGEGDGRTKLGNLLKAAGYDNDPQGFFSDLIHRLECADSEDNTSIRINTLDVPYLLLQNILKRIIPGDKFIRVKSVHQLERLTNRRIPEEEREGLQRVMEMYPVRLSKHVIRQARLSRAVAYQFLPFVDELDDTGSVHTWVGQFHRGIVEQMYRNRIIFILNMSCPVYCRFCFRKHKECRNQRAPTVEHVKNALMYVKASPDVKEIVLTGGDPFMNRATLSHAVDGIMGIPHVQTLRIATRSISYYPHLFYANNAFWMTFLKRKQLECDSKNKRIEVATHFIHPDEVSIESLDIITDLVSNGIAVYVQTPLLRDCNDQTEVLAELYEKLRFAGAEIHYLYFPCSPIKGNRSYVAPLSTGLGLAPRLRARLSDRAFPRFCTATKIGKIDWNQSGWAVEVDEKDDRFLWIRTPYTPEYYNTFAPILQMEQFARVNTEGTIDVRFMADIGDTSLLWGPRIRQSIQALYPPEQEFFVQAGNQTAEALSHIRKKAMEDQRHCRSVVDTGVACLFRPHRTRVELDLAGDDEELAAALAYLKRYTTITDIVISSENDVLTSFHRLRHLFGQLDEIRHIRVVRLRSLYFAYHTDRFSHAMINQLGWMNKLSIANPRRLEIETQFLHSSEITSRHKELAGDLAQKGITVYSNIPLLPFINDEPEEMVRIAYRLRESGIEYHHLYIAGLPLQDLWCDDHPVEISHIIDLCTVIRRSESGRGVPRFIIETPLGDVDFGLTSEIVDSDSEGTIHLKLTPYTLEYFTDIDPDFVWPEFVRINNDGYPIIPVSGLKRTQGFLVD